MNIIGHRGAKGLAPENSLQSFRKALEYGVDEIELDVRVTHDGQTILAHDPYITDASGGRLDIASHNFTTLLEHRPEACTLEAALRAVNRQVPVYIELKPRVPTKQTIAIVQQLLSEGWTSNDFRFGSYSQTVLRELHQALPDIQCIVIENWSSLRAVKRARALDTNRISMLEYWLWPGFIRAMRRRGIELYSFPGRATFKQRVFKLFGLVGATNDPTRARKWAKAGLTGVITDYPDRFTK